jgi:hypothetical protein
MRALIISFVGGLALAASAQATPIPPPPGAIAASAAPAIELIGGDSVGTGTGIIGKTVREVCGGVAAFGIGGGEPSFHSLKAA